MRQNMPYIAKDLRPAIRDFLSSFPTVDMSEEGLAIMLHHIAVGESPGYLQSKVPILESPGSRNFAICNVLLSRFGLHELVYMESGGYSERIHAVNRVLRLAEHYLREGYSSHSYRFVLAESLSVLDDVRLELYMRYSFDYEQRQRQKNGDILD